MWTQIDRASHIRASVIALNHHIRPARTRNSAVDIARDYVARTRRGAAKEDVMTTTHAHSYFLISKRSLARDVRADIVALNHAVIHRESDPIPDFVRHVRRISRRPVRARVPGDDVPCSRDRAANSHLAPNRNVYPISAVAQGV